MASFLTPGRQTKDYCCQAIYMCYSRSMTTTNHETSPAECINCDGATLEEPGCDDCNEKLWVAEGRCLYCGSDDMATDTRCDSCHGDWLSDPPYDTWAEYNGDK